MRWANTEPRANENSSVKRHFESKTSQKCCKRRHGNDLRATSRPTKAGRRDMVRPEFSVFGFQFSAGRTGNANHRSSTLIRRLAVMSAD
jgi:hypothetical protein